MVSEPRVKICLSLQAETMRRLDALAHFKNQSQPNRSATADDCLNLVFSNFAFYPAPDETSDA